MDYGEILRGLGYNLVNRGNYWQCSALFRDGDNRTALKIYKNTGVWRDFVAGGKSQPFEALVKKTKIQTVVIGGFLHQEQLKNNQQFMKILF